jgi:ABC-2 type transport system permease protein
MTRSDIALTRRWIAMRMRLTLRNPRAVTFTFAFPLLLVVLFNALNGNAKVSAMGSAGGQVNFSQFYTPSIGIFSLVTACYTSLVLAIATARDTGLLKRVRGTPLPMPIYVGSWVTGAAAVGIAGVTLMFAVSIPAFGVHIYARMLPAAVVTLLLSAATLAALGIAVASLVKSADQAMPVAQFTFLPISFISGIWFPLDGAPDWLMHVAHFFPLYHMVNAFDACFAPQTPGGGWSGSDLMSIAIWGAVGLFVAARRFRWEPGTSERGSLLRRVRGSTATA